MSRSSNETQPPCLDYELGVAIPATWQEITHPRCGCRTFTAPGGCLVFIDHPVSLLRTTPGQPRFAWVPGDNVDLMAFTDDWAKVLETLCQYQSSHILKPFSPGC